MAIVYHVQQLPLFPLRVCIKCGLERDCFDLPGQCRVCNQCIGPYYRANRDRMLQQMALYNESHRVEMRAKNLANYYARKEYYQQKSRVYRETHKNEMQEVQRAWNKANAARRAEYMRRRDAKKIAVTVGEVDYKRILERDGMWCYICEKPILPEHKIDFDHVIPITRNGTHSEDNIKVTHHVCNRRKNNKLLYEMTPYQRRGV